MADGKYIVIKRSDWEEWTALQFHDDPWQGPEILKDAVVIRTQDVFAAPALDAYANSIQVARTIFGVGETPDDGLEFNEALGRIADYFHERAVEAWHRPDKKLPD